MTGSADIVVRLDAPSGLRHQHYPATSSLLRRGTEALRLLVEAYAYAREVERSEWDFAVEISALRTAGWTNNEFRWLVCRGYVDHAPEQAASDETTRSFRRVASGPGLSFHRRTCFVLTPAGFAFACGLLGDRPGRETGRSAAGSESRESEPPPPPPLAPKWDRDRQELRLGDTVVKQFKLPAANQERILAAFEEEGWPVHIDDPLPPSPDQEPKRRLHDTINSLNRNQKVSLIRFVGDGTGQGVRWQLAYTNGNGHGGNGHGGNGDLSR
jgi:hypothetical protein